jgi:flavin-dependent dehydrogenase
MISCDVVIIGAGPSGSSAAAVLAEKGHKVILIERSRFPRYHVGESLLPFNSKILKRLGLLDKMRKSSFIKKNSVQFVDQDGVMSNPFYFNTRYPDELAQTWQVERAEFDTMLMKAAKQNGAFIMQETEVVSLIEENGEILGLIALNQKNEDIEIRAKITLDCSGKEAFSANRLAWRVKDPELNKVALWTYFEGAARASGVDEGATTVAFIPEKGWFWHIPLQNNKTSVGVVAEGKYLFSSGKKHLGEIFNKLIKKNKWVESNLKNALQIGEYWVTNEYSSHSRYCSKQGLMLAGDAYCFLDPVFSSGLMLALKSGVMAADAIDSGLIENDLSPARFISYATTLREGINNMRILVCAFYSEGFTFKALIERFPNLAGDVTDCLSGDVNKDYRSLHEAIATMVPIPKKMELGMPLNHS